MIITLKDMKNSYPVYMVEYVVQRRISGNQEFAWWIRHVLAKRNHIIGNLKSKYWVRTHKFGVKIPNSVQEEKAWDKENGRYSIYIYFLALINAYLILVCSPFIPPFL